MVRFNTMALANLLVVAAGLGGAVTQAQSGNRIDGGEPATPDIYDFYVQIDVGCAGALVASDILITSAHCVDVEVGNWTVNIGAYNRTGNVTRRVVANTLHPLYDPDSMEYDVIVLQLDEPVDGIVPVELNLNSSLPFTGENLTVIGYDTPLNSTEMPNDGLMQGTVVALNNETCGKAYGDIWRGDDLMLCAGNEEGGTVYTCLGDRGGPLLDTENKMVGIVSIGATCGTKDLPGIYTRASAMAEWIQSNVCSLSNAPVRPSFCPAFNVPSSGVTITVPFPDQFGIVGPATVVISTGTGNETVASVANVANVTDPPVVVDTVSQPEEPTAQEEPTDPLAPTDEFEGLSLRLDIHYDAYGIENAWVLRNMDKDEVIDEKNYYSVAPAGLSSTTYENLRPGNYSFMIQDYANDGVCCNYGQGYVKIVQEYDDDVVDVDNKEIWHLDGNFGAQAGVEFELLPYMAMNATVGNSTTFTMNTTLVAETKTP